MKTLILTLTFLVPGLIHASEPASSGDATTSTSPQISAPPLAFALPGTISDLGKQENGPDMALLAKGDAPDSTSSAPDLTPAQTLNGSNVEILLAPQAAPEPSSMAFSACVMALMAVLLLRMRLARSK